MRASQLRQLLNRKVGEEQLEFRIPQIFLPPRFRDLSQERDLLLMLDDDLTVHIRWHNEVFHEHHPLTPGAAKRLVGEVLKRMKRYREHLRVFGEFVSDNSEQPWDEERYHDGFRQEEKAAQRAKEARPEEEEEFKDEGQEAEREIADTLQAIVQGVDDLVAQAGGESPCPNVEY